jgi:hypothetical protein
MFETTLAPLAVTAADMDAVYFGIPVSTVGEDGDLIALGHHQERRALAAFNRFARTQWGWANVVDDRHAEAEPILDEVRSGWALFLPPDPAEGDDPDSDWYCHWTATEATPGAVPITILPSA